MKNLESIKIYIYICKQKGIRFPIVKKKTTEKGTIMREEYLQHKSNRHRLTCDPFGSLLCHAFSSFFCFFDGGPLNGSGIPQGSWLTAG